MPVSADAAKGGFATFCITLSIIPVLAGAATDRTAKQKPARLWTLLSLLPAALWPAAPTLFIVISGQPIWGQASNTHSAWEVDLLCRRRKLRAPVASRLYLGNCTQYSQAMLYWVRDHLWPEYTAEILSSEWAESLHLIAILIKPVI